MSKFFINYGTGAGNESANTLDEAMETAAANASYTQEPIVINDACGNIVARLPWYGVRASDDDVVTVDFGDSGFYGEWQVD